MLEFLNFWTLTLIGIRADTFIAMSFLDQILSAEFLSNQSRKTLLEFLKFLTSTLIGMRGDTFISLLFLDQILSAEFLCFVFFGGEN